MPSLFLHRSFLLAFMIAVAEADQVGLRSRWLYVSAVLMSVFWVSGDPYQSLSGASLAFLITALIAAVLGVRALPAGGHAGGGMLVALVLVGVAWSAALWGPAGVGGWIVLCIVAMCFWSQRGFGRRRVVLTHCGILLCIQSVLWLLLTRVSIMIDESSGDALFVEQLATYGWKLRPHTSPWIQGSLGGWQFPTLAVLQVPFFILFLTAIIYWLLVFESHWLRVVATVFVILAAMVARYFAVALCCSQFDWWQQTLTPIGLLVFGLLVVWILPKIPVGSSRIAQLFALHWWSLPSMSAALTGLLLGVLVSGHLPSGNRTPSHIYQLVDESQFVALTTMLHRMGPVSSVQDWSEAPGNIADSALIVLHPNRSLTIDELVGLQEAVEQGAGLLVLHDTQRTSWVEPLVSRFGLHLRPQLPVVDDLPTIESRPFGHPILRHVKRTSLPDTTWNVGCTAVDDPVVVRRMLAGPSASPLGGTSWGRGRVLVAAHADWFREPAVLSEARHALLEGALQWVAQPGWSPYQGVVLMAIAALIVTGIVSLLLWRPANHLQMSVSFLLFVALASGTTSAAIWLQGPAAPQLHPDDIVVSAFRTSIDLPGAPIAERVNDPADITAGRVHPIDGVPVLNAVLEAGHLPRIVSSQQQLGISRSKAIWVIDPLYYPPEPLVQQLRGYVRRGGTYVVVTTDHTLAPVANQWLLTDQLEVTEETTSGNVQLANRSSREPPAAELRSANRSSREPPALNDVSFRIIWGGTPLATSEDGHVAATSLSLGRGKIVVLTFGEKGMEWLGWLAGMTPE